MKAQILQFPAARIVRRVKLEQAEVTPTAPVIPIEERSAMRVARRIKERAIREARTAPTLREQCLALVTASSELDTLADACNLRSISQIATELYEACQRLG